MFCICTATHLFLAKWYSRATLRREMCTVHLNTSELARAIKAVLPIGVLNIINSN